MEGIDLILNYFSRSSLVTFIVLGWLSIYFIITFGVLFSRYFFLSSWEDKEKNSLEAMLMGAKSVRDDSILKKCSSNFNANKSLLDVCKSVAEKNATSGLWMLSMIASTSPFIGLFGTVVSILETFSSLGQGSGASLGIIAPAISEALVATAAGIFVAIPAYSAHLLIKRKAYSVMVYIQREIDFMLSQKNYKEKKITMYDWDESPDLNITPLVDIMLVLLAILMVTTPALIYEEKISLPTGTKSKVVQKIPEIEIRITKDRNVYIKRDKFYMDEFADNFIMYSQKFSHTATIVYIKADEELAYKDVMFVLKSVKEAGFNNVSLETNG